jgi:DNA-binding transcriptional ArsR family regulator
MNSDQKILKALNNPVRVKILRFLCKGPSCVTLTNKEINISQPNLSQHLKILKESGLVDSKKVMTKRCYFVVKLKEMKQLLQLLDKLKA